VTNFLNMMAKEVDPEATPVVEKPKLVHGESPAPQEPSATEYKAADFNPMRRKLALPIIE
jgi:hypothetical protein